MSEKKKSRFDEGTQQDVTWKQADQSNSGQFIQATSDQSTPGQSWSPQNSAGHLSAPQREIIQMTTDQLMTNQELTSSLSSDQFPVDLSLSGQTTPTTSDQSNRKRKVSSAAGSAEQERQNGKEAGTASPVQRSRPSHSEADPPTARNDRSRSRGMKDSPPRNPPTIASQREHLNMAITSQEQEHEDRKHDIGLRGVMIKDKVDMVVAHKREKSERLAQENIEILRARQHDLEQVDNVPTNNDVPVPPTLKQVSYQPEPISKLDVVPLFGDIDDGTSPPPQGHSTYGIGKGSKSSEIPHPSQGHSTYGIGKGSKSSEMPHQSQGHSTYGIGKGSKSSEMPHQSHGHSTYGIGKGFKSLDMPHQSQGHSTYGIGKGSKSSEMPHQSQGCSTYGIGKGFKSLDIPHQSQNHSPELPAHNPSMSTSDSQSPSLSSPRSASQNLPSEAENSNLHSDSADLQQEFVYPGGELPEEIVDDVIDFFLSSTDKLPSSPQRDNSGSSVTVRNNTLKVTPSAVTRNEQGPSNTSTIATFQHSFPNIYYRMCPHTTQKQCWLITYHDRVIRLVDKDGNVIKHIDVDFNPVYITMVGTDKLLVNNPNRCITQISLPDDAVSTAFYTPFLPTGICMTTTGEVLVTMADTYNHIVMPQYSGVVKYTTTGQEIRRSQVCDQFGDRLFVWPYSVCVNHGGDRVAVVNHTNITINVQQSHLIMLDSNLDLVVRYTNHGQSVSRDTKYHGPSQYFCIYDAKFDANNNVVITEVYSRSVQLLDSNCRQLRILMSCQAAVPLSLAVDVEGDLWIGYNDKSVKIIRYL